MSARVDTGADGSAVWASDIKEKNGTLTFCLLGPGSKHFSGKILNTKDYKLIKVVNSFGETETRYSVPLTIEIAGRKVNARFTLANRELKSYPALIGRRLLNKRFIVDVSQKPRP